MRAHFHAQKGLLGNPLSPVPQPTSEWMSAQDGRNDPTGARGAPTTFPHHWQGRAHAQNQHGPVPKTGPGILLYSGTWPGRPVTAAVQGTPAQTKKQQAGKEYTRGGRGRGGDRMVTEKRAQWCREPAPPRCRILAPISRLTWPQGALSGNLPSRPLGRQCDHPARSL